MPDSPTLQPCDHPHDSCLNRDVIDSALERAREAGLRRTKALRDVLHIVAEAGRPVSLADVMASGRLESQADQTTVYRLLTKLEQRGILRRIGLHDRATYYTMVFPGRHQDYLICTDCGKIEPLKMHCPVEDLEKQIAQASGYRGIYHELEFYGHCPACSLKNGT